MGNKTFVDLKGKTFGNWTVLCRAGDKRTSRGGLYWICKCSGCNGKADVSANSLISGKSTGCKICAGVKQRRRFCWKGHDTHEWGRTSSQACRACLRDKSLRTLYGITLEEFIALYHAQDAKCALCGIDLGWYITSPESGGFGKSSLIEVDHDHSKQGRESVRGLLCGRDWQGCNRKLGHVADMKWLKNAVSYIENPPAQQYLNQIEETKAS